MKKDKLEEFIQDNRMAFDTEEPSPGLWDKIEQDLPEKERKIQPWKRHFLRAAAVILVAVSAWMVNDLTDKKAVEDNTTAEESLPETPEIRELLEAEVYYASQVENRIAEIEISLSEQPELLEELQTEFRELDSAYAGLRNDLNENIAAEQIIEAMMQNHRTKANILREILDQLNQENTSHEATYNF